MHVWTDFFPKSILTCFNTLVIKRKNIPIRLCPNKKVTQIKKGSFGSEKKLNDKITSEKYLRGFLKWAQPKQKYSKPYLCDCMNSMVRFRWMFCGFYSIVMKSEFDAMQIIPSKSSEFRFCFYFFFSLSVYAKEFTLQDSKRCDATPLVYIKFVTMLCESRKKKLSCICSSNEFIARKPY